MDIRYLILGDSTLSIEVGNEVSEVINGTVMAIREALTDLAIPGIREMIPTFRSLVVCYDPDVITYGELVERCRACVQSVHQVSGGTAGMTIEIPVLYGYEKGYDLQKVADYHGITPEEVIRAHTENISRIYMLGFVAGMPYMAADNGLTIPRRATPRERVEEGSVVIQQNQTNVYPCDTPSGWNVIGHTPVKVFDLNREKACLFETGYYVKFISVTPEEYEAVKKQVEAGTYQCRIYRGKGA